MKFILLALLLSGCLVQVPPTDTAVASTYNQQVMAFWLQVITVITTAVIGPLVIWRVNKKTDALGKKADEHKEEIVAEAKAASTEAKAAYTEANNANVKIDKVDQHLLAQEEARLAAGTHRRRTDPIVKE